MSELFDTERSVITKHLRNIFNSNELNRNSNVQKMHIANFDKSVAFYNKVAGGIRKLMFQDLMAA